MEIYFLFKVEKCNGESIFRSLFIASLLNKKMVAQTKKTETSIG